MTETSARERPVIFSGPMVRAILDGRKSVTRRVVKPQPREGHEIVNEFGQWWPKYLTPLGPMIWVADGQFKCPYGRRGDRLWLKEAAYIAPPNFGDPGDATHRDGQGRPRVVAYAASMNGEGVRCAEDYGIRKGSPIFMPRWASRVMLEITGVRVERLSEISTTDAFAEGVEVADSRCSMAWQCSADTWPGVGAHPNELAQAAGGRPWRECSCVIEEFEQRWGEINGKRHPWASNPWVWVLTFRRVDPGPAVEAAEEAKRA